MKKVILMLLVVFTSCNPLTNKTNNDSKNKTIVVLKVNAQEVDCQGAHGKQKCLQIKELGVDKEWGNLYEEIEGFDFKSGYVYNLQVEKQELKNPPQDASSIRYKLLEVLKKEKPISNEEIEAFETLTVIKIENGKDGYTAILEDAKKGLYTCVISIPNLEDNYVSLEVGDKVKIAGEYAESDPVQIFAKKIKIVDKTVLKRLPELTVIKVIPGKDGETIYLSDKDKKAYNMIVSIPNMGKNYMSLKVGDKVKVEGDYVDSFPTQILARKIHKII